MPEPTDPTIRRPVGTWLAFRKEASIDERRWRARVARQFDAVALSAHIIGPGTIRRSFDEWLAVWPTPFGSARAWTSLLASLIAAAAPGVDRVAVTARDLGRRLRLSITARIAVTRAEFQDRPSLRSLAGSLSDAVSVRMHRLAGRARDVARPVHRPVAIWIAMRRAPVRDAWGWRSLIAPVADVVHSSGGQTAVGLGIGVVAAIALGLVFAARVPAASAPIGQAAQADLTLSVTPFAVSMRDATRLDSVPSDPEPVVSLEAATATPAPVATPAPTPRETTRPAVVEQRPMSKATPSPRPTPAPQAVAPPPPTPSATPTPSSSPPPASAEPTPEPTPTPDPEPKGRHKPPKPTKPPKPP
jgi:hypothetical protein